MSIVTVALLLDRSKSLSIMSLEWVGRGVSL